MIKGFTRTQHIILTELEKQGVSVTQLAQTNCLVFRKNNKESVLIGSITPLLPYNSGLLLQDKAAVRELLLSQKIPVSEGQVFLPTEQYKATEYVKQLGFPVLVRHTRSIHLEHAFPNITTQKQFAKAFSFFAEKNLPILVERYIPGKSVRILFVPPNHLNIVSLTPPMLRGDGTSTVEQLLTVDAWNRLKSGKQFVSTIKIDKELLHRHQLTLKTILGKGQRVYFRERKRWEDGALFTDVTQRYHAMLFPIVKKLFAVFPGQSYVTADIRIPRNTKEKPLVTEVYLSFGPNAEFPFYQQKNGQTAASLLVSKLITQI